MLLLPSVTLTLLVIATVTANNPPGVPPRGQQFEAQQMNVQEGQGQGHGQGHIQGHGHGHGGLGGKMKFQSEIHNADHIIEHLQNVIKTKPKDQMSEEELEFHYFKMHDYDNNNKLDGVEIGKALTHFHDDEHATTGGATHAPTATGQHHQQQQQQHQQQQQQQQPPKEEFEKEAEYDEEDLEKMLNEILDEEDLDKDGYIDYTEYKKAQKNRGEFGDGLKPYNPDDHIVPE